jgi:D-glycero-alpha-D-manno-heptose-7-phosphate kinase
VVYSKIENCKTIDQIEHPAVRAVLGYMQCNIGLEIHHDGDLPARSGLGSSSSFTVGLLHALSALKGNYIANQDLASQAIHIERDIIKENVGSQDQISAAHGGFNRIEFLRDGSFRVDPVVLRQERLEEFQSHLMLFFTGLSRFASDIAKSKIDNLKNRAAELHRMTESVHEAIRILQSDAPIEEIGRLLDQNWKYKRSLSDKVSSPEIDRIYEAAMKAGAIGGKLLGAGGGGFMVFLVKPALQKKVREALSHLIHVPFRFENNGSRVVLYQPQGL